MNLVDHFNSHYNKNDKMTADRLLEQHNIQLGFILIFMSNFYRSKDCAYEPKYIADRKGLDLYLTIYKDVIAAELLSTYGNNVIYLFNDKFIYDKEFQLGLELTHILSKTQLDNPHLKQLQTSGYFFYKILV